jgi:hypothetical protein
MQKQAPGTSALHVFMLELFVCLPPCRSGRIDRAELKVLLESVEGGLAYPLMVAEVCCAVSHSSQCSVRQLRLRCKKGRSAAWLPV